MANKIPLAIADFETSLSVAISAGATSLTLSSATDDDGNALPAGKYCFTVNNGSSNKQYLLGQLNGTAVTSVVNVSRQGVETSGAAFAARAGSPIIISDFATIQRVADILRGQIDLDGSSPIGYDAEPTLADRKDLATVGYVLDTASGGTVNFDSLTCAGNAGEAIVAGDLVYFNTVDQEWYKTDADTAATVDNVQLGIALGTGSDGVAITGGIQIAGTWTTTGLTAGSLYYASNTAGAIASSAGTNERILGVALSTTKLLILQRDFVSPALQGGGDFGTPSTTNKFLTETYLANRQKIDTFTSDGTWTKPTGAKFVEIIAIGAGGGGAGGTIDTSATFGYGGGGGAGGGISKYTFPASTLSATVTVTVGAGGAGGAGKAPGSTGNGAVGTAGEDSSFGTYLIAKGGDRGIYDNSAGASGGIGLVLSGGTGGYSGYDAENGQAAGIVSSFAPTGGGGGASYSGNGGKGGDQTTLYVGTGGAGGTSGARNGSNGTSVTTGLPIGGTGGGGGASPNTSANVPGGDGGDGGIYGAGGGGGGLSPLTAYKGGDGGDGANGIVVVMTHF